MNTPSPYMHAAPIPPNEEARLAALAAYNVMDTAEEQTFDDLTELAAYICDAPISLLTLVDRNRQFFKARHNLDLTGTSREVSFCTHTLGTGASLVVNDATQDPRFRENPLVTNEAGVRFYAGAPIIDPNGHVLGTVCVIDHKPRTLTDRQLRALEALARQATCLLEQRRLNALHEMTAEILNKATSRLNLTLDAGDFGTFTWTMGTGCLTWENDKMYRLFGRPRAQGPLTAAMLAEKIVQPADRDAFSEAAASIEEEGDHLEWSGEILGGDGTIRFIHLLGVAERAMGNELAIVGIAKGEGAGEYLQ